MRLRSWSVKEGGARDGADFAGEVLVARGFPPVAERVAVEEGTPILEISMRNRWKASRNL
jgi:hypothetical protein